MSALGLPFLFVLGAVIFSMALVSPIQLASGGGSSCAPRGRGMAWPLVVAFALSWPAAVVCLLPAFIVAVVVSIGSVLIALQLMYPTGDLRDMALLKKFTKSAYALLAVWSILSSWLMYFVLWLARAEGSTWHGIINVHV